MAEHALQRLREWLHASCKAIETRTTEVGKQVEKWLDENGQAIQQSAQALLEIHNRVTGAYIGPLILNSGDSPAAQLLNGLGLLSFVLQQSPSDMDEEERRVVTRIHETLSEIIKGAAWDAFGKVEGIKPMKRLIKRMDALMGDVRNPDADVDEKHRGRIAESLAELEKCFGFAMQPFVHSDGTVLTNAANPPGYSPPDGGHGPETDQLTRSGTVPPTDSGQADGSLRPRGVSLRDIAVLLTDGDPDAIKLTKKRWQNSRDPKLPKMLGKCAADNKSGLYVACPRVLVQLL